MSQERKIPAPPIVHDTQVFWEAANDGRLLIKRCTDCGESYFYPRDICPHCLSTATEWLQTAGRGTLYSFSTSKRGELPHTLAYVTLDEGPTMLTNIVDCDPATLQVGQAVKVVFRPAENGQNVPLFTPSE